MRADSAKKYGDEREMYNRLIKEYPASRDAEDARVALGLQSARTRMDPAIATYAQAESLVEGRQYERALALLGSIVEEHPSSPFAAKSKYTMGWIYEHYLSNPDSALSQYKQVAERFGSTAYGAAARRRLPSPSGPAPGTAPADTSAKVSPQQGLPELQKRELGVDEKERVIKAPSDTTRTTRGKRKVVVD
jgi:TolA-binding protein